MMFDAISIVFVLTLTGLTLVLTVFGASVYFDRSNRELNCEIEKNVYDCVRVEYYVPRLKESE